MKDRDHDRVGPMLTPPHLGELIRESMEEVGWTVTETATRLGCERGTLSRLLNGRRGCRPPWRWRWQTSAGAPPSTGCGCRRVTNSHRHAGNAARRNGGWGNETRGPELTGTGPRWVRS